MNFKWLFERILIDLRRLNFCKIILDVDEVFIGDDRH
jgi:hypothetical protein